MRIARILQTTMLLATVALAGCASMDSYYGYGNQRTYQRALDGAESGSRYAATLMGNDVQKIAQTAWAAVETRSGTSTLNWSSAYSGATGKISAGPNFLVGFNAGEEIEAPVDLDTRPHLRPEAGSFITTVNANVRLSPGLEGTKALMLEEGAEVQAIGYDPAKNWYLVAKGSKVIGYVFGDLVTRIEGGELLLAGGEAKQPKLCRELTYTMTLGTGQKDAWVNGACKQSGSNWRVVGGRALEVAVY